MSKTLTHTDYKVLLRLVNKAIKNTTPGVFEAKNYHNIKEKLVDRIFNQTDRQNEQCGNDSCRNP